MGGYDSGRSLPRRISRRNGNPLSAERFDIESIAAFKQMPSFIPDHFRSTRPVLEKCCLCMPLKKMEWCTPEAKELGMRNILDCRSEKRMGFLSQLWPNEVYAINKPLFKPFPDIGPQLLSNPRVQSAIQETALQIMQESTTQKEADILKSLQSVSVNTVQKMKASLSAMFIKLAAWWLTRFLSNMFTSIQVSRTQMMMLREQCKKKIPIIYLPLHRSHMDYILVTLTLWNFDIRSPYVAAGENLDIPFFNLLMRGLGGFFIRRRLDCRRGQKDVLYRAILQQYMTEILKHSEAIEFFIEGGRTRTGRAIIPKGGLLSVIVDALQTGDIEDAYIVPASFNYERIVDGNYTREQMGLPKVDESFFGAVKAILRVLFGNFGSIRVDFARPYSLKEFLNSANNNPNIMQYQMEGDCMERSTSSLLDRRLSYPNHMVTSATHMNGTVNTTRVLVKALADHTVYTADHTSTPMSTHLLAFLLLTQYREGAPVIELSSALQWIVKELQTRHVDVGFCGKTIDVIIYAQKLLGDKLVTRTLKSSGDACVFRPNLSIPNVFELSYYASFVSTHFAMDSIMACALMHESNLSLFQLMSKSILPDTTVIKENVLGVAEQLCHMLHTEFIFVPPCTSLENSLSDLMESFISKEILKEEKNEWDDMNDRDRQMANRIAKSFEIGDGEDEEQYDTVASVEPLQLNINHTDVRHQLHFLVSVLGPILESHLNVINFMIENLIDEMADKEFFHELGGYARSRVEKGMSVFSESCAMLNLRLAVKSLQDQRLVYSYNSAGLVMIGLCDATDTKDRLEKYAYILKGVLS